MREKITRLYVVHRKPQYGAFLFLWRGKILVMSYDPFDEWFNDERKPLLDAEKEEKTDD